MQRLCQRIDILGVRRDVAQLAKQHHRVRWALLGQAHARKVAERVVVARHQRQRLFERLASLTQSACRQIEVTDLAQNPGAIFHLRWVTCD